jgi:hypothetical protein
MGVVVDGVGSEGSGGRGVDAGEGVVGEGPFRRTGVGEGAEGGDVERLFGEEGGVEGGEVIEVRDEECDKGGGRLIFGESDEEEMVLWVGALRVRLLTVLLVLMLGV